MVGCVGLDVDAWQDGFYDPDLPRDWRPAYYSTLLRSVLLPEAEWLQAIASGWAEEVDNDFRIVLRIDSPAGLRRLAGLPGPLQARTVGAVVTAAALGPEQSAAVRFAALRAGTHLPLCLDVDRHTREKLAVVDCGLVWYPGRTAEPAPGGRLLVTCLAGESLPRQREIIARISAWRTPGSLAGLFHAGNEAPQRAQETRLLAEMLGV